ncbi:pseudouridine synthase [Paenalcaligenes sp. Me52]|uniref:pseudouridine synthase n=1 Tax=Paenalcaligenes sp. Me52 TaxID=3392038 RepID=UPI003D2BFA73
MQDLNTTRDASRRRAPIAPLPTKEGVSPSRVWLPEGEWLTLGEFLLQRFEYLDPDALQQRIERGDVVNDSGEPQALDTPYVPGQWLWYYREVADEAIVPFEMPILYADDRLIAVDKPHFLATTPSGSYLKETALVRLRAQFNNPDITPLHRLDRDTAGVLLFCVQPQYRGLYQSLFQSRDVQKEYEAIAPAGLKLSLPSHYCSHIEVLKGVFLVRERDDLDANSETYIEELSRWQMDDESWWCHYRLQPTTGRKHQLRMHMSSLGSPILNDSYYPYWDQSRPIDDFSLPLQLLARRIAFVDPVDGEYREFRSLRQLEALPTR